MVGPAHVPERWRDGRASWPTHTLTAIRGPEHGVLTMGYYTRPDLEFRTRWPTPSPSRRLPLLGPGSHPSEPPACVVGHDRPRPAATAARSCSPTRCRTARFSVNWTTMPELLEDNGISWKSYKPPGAAYQVDNPDVDGHLRRHPSVLQAVLGSLVLPLPEGVRPRSSRRLRHDVAHETLPQVSWIIPPLGYDEHPPSPAGAGVWFTDQVLTTLISNHEAWSKTVLFVMYDENDGFFDHVAPPVAPAGTAGRIPDRRPPAGRPTASPGRLGLGFRVPMLVVSPFSRGGYVSPTRFDHTSQFRFLEQRFGIHCSADLGLAAPDGRRPDVDAAHRLTRPLGPHPSVDLARHPERGHVPRLHDRRHRRDPEDQPALPTRHGPGDAHPGAGGGQAPAVHRVAAVRRGRPPAHGRRHRARSIAPPTMSAECRHGVLEGHVLVDAGLGGKAEHPLTE